MIVATFVVASCAWRKVADFIDPPRYQHGPRHYIVADDAFPLQENMMKPFSHKDMIHQHRIFNYRLSLARRVVENAFGILSNRFRVFFTKIALEPSKVA